MKTKMICLGGMLMLAGAMVALGQTPTGLSNQEWMTPAPKPASPDTAPSLADVARGKATAKKATHIFTNDEIPSRPEEPAATEPNSAASATEADKTGNADGKPADKSKKEEDSVEVKGAKKVIEAKTIQIDAVTEELHKLEFKLANAVTSDEASIISQQIRNLQHNIEVWNNVRGDAQKVLEEARKPKEKDQT